MGSICQIRTVTIKFNDVELVVSGVYTKAVPSTREYPGDPASFEISKVEFKTNKNKETHYVEITDLIDSFNAELITSTKAAMLKFAKGDNTSPTSDLWTSIEEAVLEELNYE